MGSDQERMLGKKTYKKIWKKSHDVSESLSTLGEYYVDVPKDIQDVQISVMTVVQICHKDEIYLKRIEAWHNDEPYSNSIDFIK